MLNIKVPFTKTHLKTAYRKAILNTHPDKNRQRNTTHEFIDVQSAYKVLLSHTSDNDSSNCSQDEDILNIIKNKNYKEIFCFFSSKCQTFTLDTFQNLDKKTALKYFRLIHNLPDTVKSYITPDTIDKMKIILEEKLKHYNIYILHPTLEDLFNYNVYKFQCDEIDAWIPLWHHELCMDSGNKELLFKCVPSLPEDITIDENNNVHIYLKHDTKNYTVNKKVFKLTKQKNTFKQQGIPRINTDDIYDYSLISTLFIYCIL